MGADVVDVPVETAPVEVVATEAEVMDMTEQDLEALSAEAVAAYEMDGSLFQQITDMEQEKIFMQLEKEAAQLDLELDRLAAEKIKLHMEIDTLAGRAEEQQAALDAEREQLDADIAKLEQQKKNASESTAQTKRSEPVAAKEQKPIVEEIDQIYRLVNISGAGKQLKATLEYLNSGQRRIVSVGQKIENEIYTVESISLADGVVFDKDGVKERLNVAGMVI
jgi:type IV pilus biogenesis protein PilP